MTGITRERPKSIVGGSAGVTRVEALGRDTYAEADAFFSYRRATHRGEPDYGRQISLIGVA